MESNSESSSLEYLYKEYVRLSDRCAFFVQGSFDDIKLYTAIGGVLAWTPISDLKFFDGGSNSWITFLGFFAILIIFIVLSMYNVFKQSLVVYYLQELRSYEEEIKILTGVQNPNIFQWTVSYSKWRNTVIKRIALHLFFIIILMLIVFPTIVLTFKDITFAAIYAVTSLVFFTIYLRVARIIFKQ